MDGSGKQTALPSSHHPSSSLRPEPPFTSGYHRGRGVPRSSAEAEAGERGEGRRAPLCRQPGPASPGAGGGGSTGRCCHLLPAAGTGGRREEAVANPTGQRARRRRRVGRERCGAGMEGESGAARRRGSLGRKRGRSVSKTTQISRTKEIKVQAVDVMCFPIVSRQLTLAVGKFIFIDGFSGCSKRNRRTIISVTLII